MLFWLIKHIVIWRLALLVVILIATTLISFKPTFPYAEQLLEPTGHPAFWSLANFDGVHYIGIADKGYFAQFTQAFFPLYPSLMRLTNNIFHNYILSGYVISHLSLVAFIYLLYKLIRLDWSEIIAQRTIIFYLLFPTAFFFASVYTESFFMMLVIGSFLAARRQKWLLAGVLGGLASATRLFGIFLLPALLIELWQQRKGRGAINFFKSNWLPILSILLSISGLVWYMWYLGKNFSDPLYFLHAQPVFGAQRSADKLILLYQVFWRYTKMLTTVNITSLLYYTVSQEFLLSTIFLLLALWSFKTTRLSYAVFGIMAYVLPTLTGTLSSMPRYVLAIFPAFIILGQIRSKPIRYALYTIGSILLAINISLFTRGYWVS